MIDFASLIGKKTLSGFDTGSQKSEYDYQDDCSTAILIIDGQAYKAVENPSDGYRSSMRSFDKTDDIVKNTFEPVEVFCRHRTAGTHHGDDDVLEIYNILTGGLILEIGTKNIDDYYPAFVCNWTPENIGEKV